MNLLIISVLIFLLNIPFGGWREHVRKFSLPWFLAVHLPVPLVIVIRTLGGVGWRLTALPFFAGAYFMGQYVGGSIYINWRKPKSQSLNEPAQNIPSDTKLGEETFLDI